jgi:hypothetical protein
MPQVRFLKYFKSFGKCQGSLLSLPITLFSATANKRLRIRGPSPALPSGEGKRAVSVFILSFIISEVGKN